MPKFQGSGFSIEVPDGTVDASNYGFAFPGADGANPTMTITFAAAKEADPAATFDEQLGLLEQAMQDFDVISQGTFKRADREYIVWVAEWGPAESRMRQKQVLMSVAGSTPRLFKITATDLAAHFDQAEPLFDNIIRTFEPNEIQVI